MSTLIKTTPAVISQTRAEEIDPADVLVTFARQPGAFALESVCNTSGYGGYSMMGYGPVDTLEVSLDEAKDPFEALRKAIDAQPRLETSELPFLGGWVGILPYEAGHRIENAAYRGPSRQPLLAMRFALYDTVAVLDHRRRVWTVVAADLPQSVAPATQRARAMAERIAQADRLPSEAFLLESYACPPPEPDMSKPAYLDRVARARAYIAAGDIYQVNLSQRWTAKTTLSPLAIYLRLRIANPSDFAAYLPWDQQATLSCSPELFLRVNADGGVVTRPIKGTHPRSRRDHAAAVRDQLRSNPKERAELNMIIDLLRNDLGRVCNYGSVKVISDADVESHPTVYHLVATIAGQLREGWHPVDLLRATFPGGSIIGCPKIRAMQIIEELELAPRGPFCGAIGYIDLAGRMNFNVAIRTLTFDRGQLNIHAGGAITADSDADQEYRETLAKAEGIFRGLGHSTRSLR